MNNGAGFATHKKITFEIITLIKEEIEMPQTTAERLLGKVASGETLSTDEQIEFGRLAFPDFLEWVSREYHVEYKDDHGFLHGHDVAKVVSTFYRKVEKGFERLGLDSSNSVAFGFKNGEDEKRVEETNVKKKKTFNGNIDQLIQSSSIFRQITNDYDILCEALNISAENRPEYKQCGAERLAALLKMIDNGGEAEILMRVIEKDTKPHGVRAAKKLVESGVSVFNYDEGEKFGAGRTWRLSNHWDEYVKKVVNAVDVKDLSEDMNIPQITIKKLGSITELPTYHEAVLFETKYNNLKLEPLPKPYEEKPWAFFICRDFFRDEKPQAEEPQLHKKFTGVVVYGWEAAAQWVLDYIKDRKTKADPARPLTKKDLEKY
jgi:hypothetical protein